MWSLLSYIKSAIYFPCVINLHSVKILDKLNRDLINILEQYFHTNIWSDWKDIRALFPECSPPFRMENARAYMCTICDSGHFITRKEKHEYLVRAVSAVPFNKTHIILAMYQFCINVQFLFYYIFVVQCHQKPEESLQNYNVSSTSL